MLSILTLWLAASASAVMVDVELCADYALTFANNYDEGTSASMVHDDFFADIGYSTAVLKPARGAAIQIIDTATGLTVFEEYADWGGATSGCVSTTLDSGVDYDIKIRAEASVNGSVVSVRNPDTDNTWASWAETSWSPTPVVGGGTLHVDIQTGVHDAWRIASVIGWGLTRVSGGQAGTFIAYTGGCVSQTGNALGGACAYKPWALLPVIKLYVSDPQNKYRTAHELGHALQFLATGTPNMKKNAAPGVCYTDYPTSKQWEQNSKEYQSIAAVDGIADFYAALVFNRYLADDDCFYHTRETIDWDLDGVLVETPFPSCKGAPYAFGAIPGSVSATDYLGNYCGGGWNRGVPFDHVRFYWALRTDSTYATRPTFADVLDIWSVADPAQWNADDAGPLLWWPAERLSFAAWSLGWGAQWDALATTHGAHR